MNIELRERTEKTVITYFNMTRDAEICKYLPQKAKTETEALADFYKTQLPGATSYGRAIYVDGFHIGDIWCYCIQAEAPNAMISYCIFDRAYWGKGIATTALRLFLEIITAKYEIKTIGAFTFSANQRSIQVLQKCGFLDVETLVEDGIASKYFQLTMHQRGRE